MNPTRLPRHLMCHPQRLLRAFLPLCLGAMGGASLGHGAESAELQALEQQVKLLAQKIEARAEAETKHAAVSTAPQLRQDENLFTTRFQLSF